MAPAAQQVHRVTFSHVLAGKTSWIFNGGNVEGLLVCLLPTGYINFGVPCRSMLNRRLWLLATF
jgi:hypothetical protein